MEVRGNNLPQIPQPYRRVIRRIQFPSYNDESLAHFYQSVGGLVQLRSLSIPGSDQLHRLIALPNLEDLEVYNVSSLPALHLRRLWCNGGTLREFPPQLEVEDLRLTRIDIHIPQFLAEQLRSLEWTPVTQISLPEMPKLRRILLRDAQLLSWPQLPQLMTADLQGCDLRSLPCWANLISLNISRTNVAELPSGMIRLRTLIARNSKLRTLRSEWNELRRLDLQDSNSIRHIPTYPKLKVLSGSSTLMRRLKIGNHPTTRK
jgi:hypothetical protein